MNEIFLLIWLISIWVWSFIYKLQMDFFSMTLGWALELKFQSFLGFNRALRSYQWANGLTVTLDFDEIIDKEIKKRVARKQAISGLKKVNKIREILLNYLKVIEDDLRLGHKLNAHDIKIRLRANKEVQSLIEGTKEGEL